MSFQKHVIIGEQQTPKSDLFKEFDSQSYNPPESHIIRPKASSTSISKLLFLSKASVLVDGSFGNIPQSDVVKISGFVN